MKNIKNILLICILLLLSGSLMITPVITSYFDGLTVYIILITLVIILILIGITDINSITIKQITKHKLLHLLLLVYLTVTLIHVISILELFINNLFYKTKQMSIFAGVLMILVIILALNKRIVTMNIFFILNIFSVIIIMFFTLFFPKSNLLLKFDNINNDFLYIGSYLTLFLDLLFYKLYFTTKTFKTSNKIFISSVIISFLILTYFAYLDLTIAKIRYTNTYFSNILKFLLVLPTEIMYFNYLYLGVVIITLLFKIIILGDVLRCLLIKKKTKKVIFLLYFILFFTANTISNQVKLDNNLLNILTLIVSTLSYFIIIILGGIQIAKRLYQRIKK